MKYRTEYIYRKFILILLVEIMIGMACTFIGLFIRIIPYKEGVIYDIESISSIIGFLFLINGLLFFFIVFFASKLYCNKEDITFEDLLYYGSRYRKIYKPIGQFSYDVPVKNKGVYRIIPAIKIDYDNKNVYLNEGNTATTIPFTEFEDLNIMVGECPLFQNGYYREILNKTNIDKIAASMRMMIKDKYTPITFLFKAKGDNDYSKNVKFTVRDLSSPFTISEDLIRISMDVLIHVRNINSYNFELKIENLEESLEEVDLHDLFVDDDVVDFGEDNCKESAEEVLLNINSIENDMPDILRRYFDLYREGIISKEEFEDKKKKLLEL